MTDLQVTVSAPDVATIAGPAQAALNMMKSVKVDSIEVAEIVNADVQRCAKAYRELEERRKAITTPLDDAKARIMDLFRGPLAVLADAKAIGSAKLIQYQREQEEARRRIREAAEAEARKERERLAREAADAAAKAAAEAAELRRKADEAAAAGRLAEAAKLEAKATTKEEAGEAKQETLSAESATIPQHVMVAPVKKLSGLSAREHWTFEITDASKIPREYLIPDEKAIGAVVRALKDKARIEGVRIFPRDSAVVRSK